MNHIGISLIAVIRYRSFYARMRRRLSAKSDILDFGCGRGDLIFYLRGKGWSVYGVDPAASGSEDDGIFSSIEGLRKRFAERFDAVILNFSVEHLSNPRAELDALRCVLKPHGRLFMRLPDPKRCGEKGLLGFQGRLPGHRDFSNRYDVQKLLEEAGFVTLEAARPFCPPDLLTIPCGILPGLDPHAWFYDKPNPLKYAKAVLLGFLSLLFLPISAIRGAIGKGDILYFVAGLKR